jgi:RND family efflux transporter MFP subunit
MTRQAILLATLAGVAACGKPAAGDARAGDAQPQPVVGARTIVVTTKPFSETINAIGAVSPAPGHVASLAAPAPTRVSGVLVVLGEQVAQGQPLVELDKTTFDAALASAEAAVRTATASYDRVLRLATAGISPRREVDQAAAELAAARANHVAAQRAKDLSTLRAPIAGVITRMNAVLGASADVSQTLVEVTDPAVLDVLLQLSPAEAARVHPGQQVTLTAGQSAAGESLGEGSVGEVSAGLDSATRTVAARVRVTAPKRTLRIGETVMGTIVVGRRDHAITVPTEALVPDGEGYKVFVVDTADVAHARPVTVGARTTAAVEILKGLRAGETVVTYGAFGVADSAKISRMKP